MLLVRLAIDMLGRLQVVWSVELSYGSVSVPAAGLFGSWRLTDVVVAVLTVSRDEQGLACLCVDCRSVDRSPGAAVYWHLQ